MRLKGSCCVEEANALSVSVCLFVFAVIRAGTQAAIGISQEDMKKRMKVWVLWWSVHSILQVSLNPFLTGHNDNIQAVSTIDIKNWMTENELQKMLTKPKQYSLDPSQDFLHSSPQAYNFRTVK